MKPATMSAARRVKATVQPKPVATKVTLQDHGQDFLEWDLDEDGVVLDSRPCQAWAWSGVRVLNHRTLRIGQQLRLQLKDGREITLNYPAAGVMRMPKADAGRAR